MFGPTLVVASVFLSAVACTEANRRPRAEPAHLTETRLNGSQLNAALLTAQNLGPRFTRIPPGRARQPAVASGLLALPELHRHPRGGVGGDLGPGRLRA